jgi:hypothetical protein
MAEVGEDIRCAEIPGYEVAVTGPFTTKISIFTTKVK